MSKVYEEWGDLVEPLNQCYELCKTARQLCTLMESFPGINIIVALLQVIHKKKVLTKKSQFK